MKLQKEIKGFRQGGLILVLCPNHIVQNINIHEKYENS